MSEATIKPEKSLAVPERWQTHLAFVAGAAALLLWYRDVIYFWQGEWFGRTGYYTHGPLVPVLAALLIWMRREQLAQVPVAASLWGVAVIAAAGLLKIASTWMSTTGVEAFASITFPIMAWGLLLSLYGWGIARMLAGPIAFLWLMCPVPGYTISELSFPLQHASTRMGAALAWLAGVNTMQEGTTVHLAQISLFVDVACSGFRAILALLTLTAFAAATSRLTWGHKAVMLVSAAPIALVANAARIASIIWAADRWGQKGAMFAHDNSGLVMLALAGLCVFGIAKVLGWLAGTDTW